MEPRQTLTLDQIDLSDLAFWGRPLEEREGAFKTLREQRPLAFFAEPEILGLTSVQIPRGPGYYALTRHADVLEASRQPELFCSGKGATSQFDMPEAFLEFFGSMINLDDRRHARLRRIVSAAFTPKRIKNFEDQVQVAAARIVDQIIDNVDGEHLNEAELGSFFILLVVAGNETTRNAISHGMKLLTDNPDQRKVWAEDFDGVAPTAVEEIVRVSSPVIFMRRTATQDTTLADHPIKEGDKLILY